MKDKIRAKRNRTIFLSQQEYERVLSKCVTDVDVSQCPLNTTVCADAFSVLDKLPDGIVDLLIVDPPYNLLKTYGTSKFHKMTSDNYEAYTRRWVKSALHTLKDTASIYVCCDWETSLIVGRVLSEYFIVRNRITWQREKGRGAKSNWKNSMEDIWFATVSKEYTFNVDAVKQRRRVIAPYRKDGKPKDWQETKHGNFRDTYPSNFWDDVSIPYWSMPENTDHPVQKPEKLIAKLVLASSSIGGVVLDPFLGSGTTSVVAKKLGRQYIGIEREPAYCALAEKRLEMAEQSTLIQGYTDGVFWERNSLREQKVQAGQNGKT